LNGFLPLTFYGQPARSQSIRDLWVEKGKIMEQQLVIFELANEYYGVDIASVESIIKMEAITVVPQSPSFVEGVINLRGSILPVVDLHKRFKLASGEAGKDARIVVVNIDGVKVGMVVDGVSEVLRVSEDAVEPPPPMVTNIDSAFITGIAKINGKLVIMLDLNRVLSTHEKADLSASVAAV
jgi:purine-binding chemotaxis protein CheW